MAQHLVPDETDSQRHVAIWLVGENRLGGIVD
jgi:hypothetical protein